MDRGAGVSPMRRAAHGDVATVRFAALGTTASVTVTDAADLPVAEQILRTALRELDRTVNRFRRESELCRLLAHEGRPVRVSARLLELLVAALRAHQLTDGAVDPTVGRALTDLGYDRDHSLIRPGRGTPTPARRAPGPAGIVVDAAARTVTVPPGVRLDLGATSPALTLDRTAATIAGRCRGGVLVTLGGDAACAGVAPIGGWLLDVGDPSCTALVSEPRRPWRDGAPGGARAGLGTDDGVTPPPAVRPGSGRPVVAVGDGGVATSSTTTRTWTRGGRPVHHLVDPRTGRSVDAVWCTVSVAAATCLDANTASTAAVVMGEKAAGWLDGLRLPSWLRREDGTDLAVAGWPVEPGTAAGSRDG